MLSFARRGCLIFVGLPVVTTDQFLGFTSACLHQEDVIDLPRTTGQDLYEVTMAEKLLLGVWVVWSGMKLRLCRLPFCWVDSQRFSATILATGTASNSATALGRSAQRCMQLSQALPRTESLFL